MVLQHNLNIISIGLGIIIGLATMIYLFTIPDVIKLSALQVSQVYALTALGIVIFSAQIGTFTALFFKNVVFKIYIG